MGSCCSSESLTPEQAEQRRRDQARTRELEKALQDDQRQDRAVSKLLLLGAGESGKSTLFKQMITIYGKGFSDSERASYVSIIHNNIVLSMKTLCKQCHTYGPVASREEKNRDWLENDVKEHDPITPQIAAIMANLWKDAGIRKTYENRAHFQLTDSAEYFFGRLADVGQPTYLPTQQDVLRSRVRTTGIVENDFEIDNNKFKMFDVGGQRNERKKWIHCFEHVTAVMFVVALSEYDQVCYEDENTNRMTEALNLFDEILNSRWFIDTAMILFLNKRDLFAIKIQKVPLTVWDANYTGGQDYDTAVSYLQDVFEKKETKLDEGHLHPCNLCYRYFECWCRVQRCEGHHH